MISGDWRPGFLSVGGPLIFASSFKVLDLIVEWVLGDDARTSKGGALQFNQKVTRINEPTRLWPDFLRDQLWIKERFVALYEGLYPYRNTIIHSANFSSVGGGVTVAPSEGKGTFGDEIHIDSKILSHIAQFAVLLVKILEETWELNQYTNHRLRWSLNNLSILHKLPLDVHIRPPSLALVRIHCEKAPYINFDISAISSELNRPMIIPSEEYGDVDARRTHALFDLEIIIMEASNQKSIYLIPFTSIDTFQNGISLKQLEEFEVDQMESI